MDSKILVKCKGRGHSIHFHLCNHRNSILLFSSSKRNLKCATASASCRSTTTTRRVALLSASASAFIASPGELSAAASDNKFLELPYSGGVKALDLIVGSGPEPVDGDQVAIHYYGRLAAKQGWRFDSTYDHKDDNGEPVPFVFTLGSGKVIPGIEAAVRSMKVGGIRRVVIPPSQGYQNTQQEPIPPNAKAFHYHF